MEKRKRIDYINGLKGAACVGVMLGHFTDMVFAAQDASKFVAVPKNPLTHLIMLAFSENLYLEIFFIVSGFLVALSAVDSPRKLAEKSFARALRFLLPIFFAGIIIFLIAKILGFYNTKTVDILTNWWLQSQYNSPVTIKDIFTDPIKVVFLGRIKLNHPYWVISRMFASSIIIYIFSFLLSLAKSKGAKTAVYCALGLIFAAALYFREIVYVGCLLGMIISWLRPQIAKIPYVKYICAGLFAVMSLLCYFTPGIYVFIFWAAALMLCFLNIGRLQKLFSAKPLMFLGDISFGVYSFHWPVWNSLGCLMLIKFFGKMDGTLLFVFMLTLASAVTCALAYAFSLTFEKWADKARALVLRHMTFKRSSK